VARYAKYDHEILCSKRNAAILLGEHGSFTSGASGKKQTMPLT